MYNRTQVKPTKHMCSDKLNKHLAYYSKVRYFDFKMNGKNKYVFLTTILGSLISISYFNPDLGGGKAMIDIFECFSNKIYL